MAEQVGSSSPQPDGVIDDLGDINVELNAVDASSSALMHVYAVLRAFVSIFAQPVLWMGAYGWLETECWFEPCEWVLWRELFYCSTGLALFFVSDAFLDNSFVEEAYEQDEYETAKESRASAAKFFLRCMAALAGSVMHNTGVWTILDEHVNPGSWGSCSSANGKSTGVISCSCRNLGCMVLGMLMLYGSGTLYSNSSISPLTLQVSRRIDPLSCPREWDHITVARVPGPARYRPRRTLSSMPSRRPSYGRKCGGPGRSCARSSNSPSLGVCGIWRLGTWHTVRPHMVQPQVCRWLVPAGWHSDCCSDAVWSVTGPWHITHHGT